MNALKLRTLTSPGRFGDGDGLWLQVRDADHRSWLYRFMIAGKPRPYGENDASDHLGRGNRRGAIRAKLLDWLAASRHASQIAAVRPAQPRHGGAGAVYVVLRRGR